MKRFGLLVAAVLIAGAALSTANARVDATQTIRPVSVLTLGW